MNALHNALLKWFTQHQRPMPWRNTRDPWAIWVSEVMLQQTRVDTVIPYFERFLAMFPSPRHLAQAETDQVLKQWEGLGYYARARNLQKAAVEVEAACGGVVPNSAERFLQLKGVGPYIAAAVQSIAFNSPLAAVDGNVKRVLSRLTLCDAPVNAADSHSVYQPTADKYLNQKNPGDHNQAMMELGAKICLPQNPLCAQCPISKHCKAHTTNVVRDFPKLVKKKGVPTRKIAVGVIQKNDTLLITKRKSDGLLGGLWEFPGGGIEAGESASEACLREIKEEVHLNITVDKKLTTVRHAYTHFKIVMEVFLCTYTSGRIRLNGPVDFKWVTHSQLSKYAFPRANNKFIPLLLKS